MSSSSNALDTIAFRNSHGIEVDALRYGGIIRSIRVPDRDGRIDDVVLGPETAAGYADNAPFFGALVGRFGNRIARGRFTLDGTAYTLAINNGPNHLHGGIHGWNRAVWDADPFHDATGTGVILRHTSPDGDEGYPGTVRATVTYTLTDRNELRVDYLATTDKPTVINLTQHSYFNLAGSKASDILGHVLTLAADKYTPVDAGLIPTGEVAPVEGTPFDFRRPTAIGARIAESHQQLKYGGGYDHNFVIAPDLKVPGSVTLAARVVEPITGRTLEVLTTEPGVQFYTANSLDLVGKGGIKYGHHAGFCLETQHFPDSPNQPHFPSTVLRPGEEYRSTTVFALGSDQGQTVVRRGSDRGQT